MGKRLVLIENKDYPNPHGYYNLRIWRPRGQYSHSPLYRDMEVDQRCVDRIAKLVQEQNEPWDVEFLGGAVIASAYLRCR